MPTVRADQLLANPQQFADQTTARPIVRADDLINGRIQEVKPVVLKPRQKQVDINNLELEASTEDVRRQQPLTQFAAGAADFFVDQLPAPGSITMLYGNAQRIKEKILPDLAVPGFAPTIPGVSVGQSLINVGQKLRELGEAAKQSIGESEVIPDLPVDATSAEKIARDLGSGASSLAVSLLAGLTVGPGIVGAGFGAVEAGESFSELESQGRASEEAVVLASALGFVEGGLEYWGLSKFLDIGGASVKAVIRRALAEGVQELEQTGANGVLRTAFGLREWEGVDSLVEIGSEALYAGALGVVLGFAGGAVVDTINAKEDKKAKDANRQNLVNALSAIDSLENALQRAGGLDKNQAGEIVDRAAQIGIEHAIEVIESASEEQAQAGSVAPGSTEPSATPSDAATSAANDEEAMQRADQRAKAEESLDVAIIRANLPTRHRSGDGVPPPPRGIANIEPHQGDDRLFELRPESATEAVRRLVEDYNIRIKLLVAEVERQLGPGRVKEANDVYLYKDNLPNQIGDMSRRVRQRLREYISNIIKDDLSVDEVDKFLLALHARERNDRMNAQRAEAGKKPVDGLSGMTYKEAEDYLSSLDKDPARKEKLWKYNRVIQAMNEDMLNLQVEAGLLTASDAKMFRERYRHYVPLQRDVDDEMYGHGGVGGINVAGPEFLKAVGSQKQVLSITGNVFAQGERVGARILRNQAAQSLLGLVQENPELSSIFEVVRFDRPLEESESGELVPVHPENPRINEMGGPLSVKGRVFMFPSEVDAPQVVEETDMADKLDERSGYNITDIYKDRKELRPEWVGVKVNGHQYYIRISDEGLRNAFKNIHVVKVPEAVRHLRLTMNILSSLITRYNPEFVVSNFMRDFGEAVINMQEIVEKEGFDLREFTGSVVKGIPTSMGTIWKSFDGGKGILSFGRAGVLDPALDKFLQYGSATGHYWMEDVREFHDLVHEMEREIRNIGTDKAKNALRWGARFVDDYNTMVELGVRFSLFKELVARGMSERKAAAYASDLTINFSRQGEWSPVAKLFKLFFQPAVAGASRTIRATANSKAVKGAILGLMISGGLWELLSHIIDPDGNEQIDDWMRNHRLSIPDGQGGVISFWTMPYGYTTFWAIGRQITRAAVGDATPQEAMLSVLNTGMISFSPFGNAEEIWAPSLVKPFYDIALNKAWYDGPVYPEDIFSTTPKPDHMVYFKSASQWSVFLAEMLNKVSGGTEGRSGLVDLHPNTLQYLADQYGGGLLKFVMNTYESGARASRLEFNPNRTPFVRQIYRNGFEERWTYQSLSEPLKMARKKVLPELVRQRFFEANDRALEMELIDIKKHRRNIQDFLKGQYKIDWAVDDFRSIDIIMNQMPEADQVRLLKTYDARTIRRIMRKIDFLDATK